MNDAFSLYLISPVIEAPSGFADMLRAACAEPAVAAVMLRLAPADERTQINRLKVLAPLAQKHDTAAIVSLEGETAADIASIAARGGADGVHIDYDEPRLRELAGQMKGARSIGVGGLRSRDDAMRCGEMGADYVMFGEPRPDGFVPPRDAITERAAWWAEIFETPCAVFAPDMASIEAMARTGAEFIALGDAAWTHPEGVAAAIRQASAILDRIAAERTEEE